MIVDSPIVSDMALGAERRIMQQGDAQLLFPASIQAVALAIRPTRVNAGATVSTESIIAHNNRVNNSQAASADTIISLAPGLYELEYMGAAQFDFANGFGVTDDGLRITLEYLGQSIVLFARFAQVGSFYDYGRVRVLLNAPTTIVHRVGVTALAEHVHSRVMVNAIRIL